MRTYHEVLTAAVKNRKAGNHRVEFLQDGDSPLFYTDDGYNLMKLPATITRVFVYHDTVICAVDDINKQFYLTHGGWFSRSTNEALAGYREVFEYKNGYENVTKIPVWMHER